MSLKYFVLITFPIAISSNVNAQTDSSISKKRLWGVVAVSSTMYVASLIALNEVWYKNTPRTHFHFFNDNPQWRQIDKIGHAYSAYHISRSSFELLRWAGLPSPKASLWAALSSQIIMIPIEVLDGFSANYGASWGDLLANLSGALLWWGQYQIWKEPHVHFKFSFSPSPFATLRPNVLGKNFAEQLIKDYNGQTYWLSIDWNYFAKIKKFPQWINLAIGTAAYEMVYARESENNANGFYSYRRFFFLE